MHFKRRKKKRKYIPVRNFMHKRVPQSGWSIKYEQEGKSGEKTQEADEGGITLRIRLIGKCILERIRSWFVLKSQQITMRNMIPNLDIFTCGMAKMWVDIRCHHKKNAFWGMQLEKTDIPGLFYTHVHALNCNVTEVNGCSINSALMPL